MATIRRTAAGTWEMIVKRRPLAKPVYARFPTEEEARDYAARLETLLAQGIVPAEFAAADAKPMASERLHRVISAYLATPGLPAARVEILNVLRRELQTHLIASVDVVWAELWVTRMKREMRLAPGTIRKRISALAYVLDHHHRTTQDYSNPLRRLPRGIATYSPADVSDGEEARVDVVRDRRLTGDEHDRILRALAGEKREDRERALDLPYGNELTMLYQIIVDTGLRLREAYTLARGHVDLARNTINVMSTKRKPGAAQRPRQVPIKPALRAGLEQYIAALDGERLFPSMWDGTVADLRPATSRISRAFGRLFEYAGVTDCTEHDLRHEATCRWFELRDSAGRWLLSEIEICRVMGWSDSKLALRYASLRGSDIAARLYGGGVG